MSEGNLSRDQFNEMIPKREQSRMEGEALGAHLWQGVNDIFGNVKASNQGHAYDVLRKNFPEHEIHLDEDENPYVEHKQGPWTMRHHAGPYAEIDHARHGNMDLINWGNNGEGRHVKPEHLEHELNNWVQEYGNDALDHHRTNRPAR